MTALEITVGQLNERVARLAGKQVGLEEKTGKKLEDAQRDIDTNKTDIQELCVFVARMEERWKMIWVTQLVSVVIMLLLAVFVWQIAARLMVG